MGFFTSNLGLADTFADPKVEQAFGPGRGRALSSSQPTQSMQGMLTNLGQSTQRTSDAFSYNIPSSDQLWSAAGYIGSGVTGGLTGGEGVTTPLPFTTTPTDSIIGGVGDGTMTVPTPVGDSGSDGWMGPIPVVGSDEGDTTPASIQTLEQYLQSKEQTPRWLSAGARTFIPGFSAVATLSDIGRGINPFYDTVLGDALGASPTFDWYEGNTDWTGRPVSDSTMGGWMNSPSAVEERNIVDFYGFGSDEHMDFLDRGSDVGLEGASEDKGLFGTITDWFSPTPAPTPETPAPVAVEPQVPGVVYGHPEVVAPIQEEAPAPVVVEPEPVVEVVDKSWGYESSGGEGTWTDDTGSTWSTDDYSSQEEYDDDWSFDEGGWDDASSDPSGGGDSGGGDSGGGSYIATAATQALGEEGLKIFEEWRDYMFDALPTFTTSYGRYRVTAPKIVEEIDKKENSKHIYSWIWDMHLKPIFNLITEDKDSSKALKDYKIMVRELQDKFLKEKR